jgi:hypothetical protein
MAKVVKCPQKGPDGSRCDVMLQPNYNVCPVCATKVDPEWFRDSPSLDDKNNDLADGEFLLKFTCKNSQYNFGTVGE